MIMWVWLCLCGFREFVLGVWVCSLCMVGWWNFLDGEVVFFEGVCFNVLYGDNV